MDCRTTALYKSKSWSVAVYGYTLTRDSRLTLC